MNKLLTYLLLIGSLHSLSAQNAIDSTAVNDYFEAEAVEDTAIVPLPVIEHVYTERSFDPNFKDKYKTPEFTYETKARAKSLWDRFWEAIGNFFDRIFSTGNKTTGSSAFTIFLRIIAFLVIGFVVYMIVRIILNKEGMWIFGRSRKKINVQDADVEDIHQMDFSELTQTTKKGGDYKLAIRYYYLWLLKKLADNEIIDWHWDKTNSDYLYEIKNDMLKKDFEYLSYVYDYSWYGDFPIDNEAFTKAEKAFLKTLNTL
ncbi:DUF4129 domain-containing protein [Flavobacterium sp. NRK1]|uniref:DUF4129 domain-containing protein n=1 Tax=Flavobacterium sp. NRK1 TaxID=2954929 RepID=UPI002091F620|nr:DUF4129 domain-containing protein [Flavobacterium sp. NRK1]MCO6148627.1 DUF4129 domain-containing protein [Flavobacterium sp. NRK1]